MSTLNSGAQISLEEAQNLVKAFQAKFPNEVKSFLIDIDLVKLLVSQPDCSGMRIYFGYDESQKKITPVLIGVNEQNVDLTKGVILDRMTSCPEVCPTNSEL